MFEATANDDHRVGRAKAAANDDHSLVWASGGHGSGAYRKGGSSAATRSALCARPVMRAASLRVGLDLKSLRREQRLARENRVIYGGRALPVLGPCVDGSSEPSFVLPNRIKF